jgi:hypothetical protein
MFMHLKKYSTLNTQYSIFKLNNIGILKSKLECCFRVVLAPPG